jgi:hypothetical protein
VSGGDVIRRRMQMAIVRMAGVIMSMAVVSVPTMMPMSAVVSMSTVMPVTTVMPMPVTPMAMLSPRFGARKSEHGGSGQAACQK